MATELGQAYVQIMPSAKGISGSISKQIDPEAVSAGTSAGQSMGRSMLAAMGIAKIASVATNAIKGSLDSAISRFDTMQKFPKVMSALGFSADDSKRSINKLGNGIDGLPTKLDDVVASTQQMTAITGNLDRSTDTVLALNNAFLASGADSAKASRGMEQFNKIISTGKVELDSWTTLQETMPLALQKTAEAMGFTGKTAQQDLYKALQSGKITVEDFNSKLIELGTGTGMFASLAKENSLGIATSFGNLRNSIAKNMANIITKFDKITKKLTGKTIAQNIDGLKVIINSTFGAIIKAMDGVVPIIDKVKDSMNFTLIGYIIQDTISILNSFWKAISGGAGKDKAISVISGVFKTLGVVIEQALQNVALFLDALSTSKTAEILGQAFGNLKDVIFAVAKSVKDLFTSLSSQADSSKVIDFLVSAVKIAAEAFLFLTEKVKELAPIIMNVLGKSVSWIIKNFGTIKTVVVSALAGFLAFKTIATTITVASAAVKAFSTTMTVLKVAMAVGKDIQLLKFALTNMASASKLAAAGQKALNFVLSINPVVAIAAAVVGLVAAVIYLWKTNEGFRTAVINVWNSVKSAFVSAKDALVGAWNGVSEFFQNIWSGIKNGVSSAFNSVVQTISSVWNGMKSISSSIWTAITSGIMAIVQPFIDTFMMLWNSVSDGLSMAWNGIVLIAKGVWELLKTVIMAPILILIDLITLNFGNLKNDLALIWDSIKNAVVSIWNGMLSFFGGISNAIFSAVTVVFETLKNWLSDAWNSVYSTSIVAWNSLKNGISAIVNALSSGVVSSVTWIKDTAINIFNAMINGAISLWNGFKDGVVNIVNSIVSGAQNAWNMLVNGVNAAVNSVKKIFDTLSNINLLDIGKAIIDGFVNGLKGAWESGKKFISGIGDWIREHKGPIEYDRKLLVPAGNAIMNGLNNGLQDRFKDVKSTVSGMANSMRDSFNVGQMINDELASVSSSNLQAKLQSGSNLVKQVIDSATGQTSNDDVLRAIKDMANRPIVTETKLGDDTLLARSLSRSVTQQQYYDERTDNRMRGILI